MTAADERSDDIHSIDLPPSLARTLAAIVGLEGTPATLGDLVDRVTAADAAGDEPLPDLALCRAEDARHTAVADGDPMTLHCVLDALVLPFVLESDGPVAVHSRPPGDAGDVGNVGDVGAVGLLATTETVTTLPATAVVSIGGVTAGDDDPSVADAYSRCCPYINAFPTRAAYEDWAATTGAETVAIPPGAARELARAVSTAVSTDLG